MNQIKDKIIKRSFAKNQIKDFSKVFICTKLD